MTKSTDLGVQSDLPAKTTEIDEMQAKIDRMLPHYHPRSVRQEALLKVAELSDEGSNAISIGDAVTQALVLKEFDLGILMGMSLPDHLKTFAIQLSLDLQRDYKCESAGKMSSTPFLRH